MSTHATGTITSGGVTGTYRVVLESGTSDLRGLRGEGNLSVSGAASQADIDAVVAHLTERGVALLFETPRHRPEFTESEAQTYYQVMFESPDRILLEVVYTGPKSA